MLARFVACTVAVLALASGALAQTYPARPVRIIVPFSAGGLTDVLGRGIASELTKLWGQRVLVENRAGANTIIAAELVAKSPPDGYTILLANDPTLSLNQYMYSKLPYDPVRDFTPVINILQSVTVLVVTPSLAANTLQELIAMAKARPGEITYGTFGYGSSTHLDTVELSTMAGIKLNHIPFKGIAEVLPAVMSGQINMALSAVAPALANIRSGRLKALAYAGAQRNKALPNVPTYAEAGLPGFFTHGWFGFVVPAGTPREVIEKIAADTSKVITAREFDEKFISGVGMELINQGPAEYAEFLVKDRAQYARRVKEANVKQD